MHWPIKSPFKTRCSATDPSRTADDHKREYPYLRIVRRTRRFPNEEWTGYSESHKYQDRIKAMKHQSCSILVVGLGKMGLSHFAIASALCKRSSLAVVEPTRFVRRYLSRTTPEVCLYDSVGRALEQRDFSHAIVATPPDTHFDIAKQLLLHRINVLVEKPTTASLRDTFRLRELQQSTDAVVATGYVNRHNPVFVHVKEVIGSGRIGSIRRIKSEMRGSVVTKPINGGWRGHAELGGGCLYEYGAHAADLITYFGSPCYRVSDASGRNIASRQGHDEISAKMELQGGVIAEMYVNWSDPTKRKASNTVEVIGTHGWIKANKSELTVSEEHNGSPRNSYTTMVDLAASKPLDYYLRGEDFTLQMVQFLQTGPGAAGGPKLLSDLDTAIESERILDLIQQKVHKDGTR